MAKIIWGKELEHYASRIARIGENAAAMCGKTVYEMAGIVADKIAANIDAMPYVSDAEGLKRYTQKGKADLTYSEKKGLQESLGISKMQDDGGYRNVKIGFDGYNDVKTRKYPNGQPNVMIARAIESGSSVRDKKPFVRPAVNAAKSECLKRAQEIITEEINKIKK